MNANQRMWVGGIAVAVIVLITISWLSSCGRVPVAPPTSPAAEILRQAKEIEELKKQLCKQETRQASPASPAVRGSAPTSRSTCPPASKPAQQASPAPADPTPADPVPAMSPEELAQKARQELERAQSIAERELASKRAELEKEVIGSEDLVQDAKKNMQWTEATLRFWKRALERASSAGAKAHARTQIENYEETLSRNKIALEKCRNGLEAAQINVKKICEE